MEPGLGKSFLWFRCRFFFDAVYHHATHGGFRYALSVNKDFTRHASDVALPDLYCNFNAKLITRDHRTAKACTLNSGKNHQLFVAVFQFKQQQCRAGLGHGFHNQHAGHDGLAGKMANKKRLVCGDILERHNLLPALDLHDPVQKKKWIAVWQNSLNILDAERTKQRFAGRGISVFCGFYSLVHC
jgi:hypothetical protein